MDVRDVPGFVTPPEQIFSKFRLDKNIISPGLKKAKVGTCFPYRLQTGNGGNESLLTVSTDCQILPVYSMSMAALYQTGITVNFCGAGKNFCGSEAQYSPKIRYATVVVKVLAEKKQIGPIH